MPRENLQLELVELQRRVATIETKLGLTPAMATSAPIGDATALAEQLVLKRELLTLRRRVQVIEEWLGVPMPAAPIELAATPPTPRPVVPPATRQAAVAARAHSAFQPPARVELTEVAATIPTTASNNPAPAAPPADPIAYAPFERPHRPLATTRETTPEPDALDGQTLERLIGGKWFGWIGSIAVVIGVGLLMKYGYDHHWFVVPPVIRCLLAAAFGLVLIGAGEVVRKRLNVVAAAGLLAAGVGTVYASAFAAYRLYGLLTEVPGMVLLALAAGLGIGIGVRSRLISVTALSLIGGYLAPFIIPGYASPAVLPVFLLMLMTVGLTISAVLGGKFRALRVMVWWATLIIGGGWTLNVGLHHTALALTFLGLVWAGVHAELIYATRRAGNAETDLKRALSWRPVLSSFSSTAWCVVLGVKALDAAGLPDWIAPASLMSATAMLWLALAGALDTLRETPRTDAERLGAAMFAQAAGLLLVTIALAFSAWGEVASWTILSLAAFVAARWLRTRALDIYAIVTLGITTLRVLALEALNTRTTGTPYLGFVVSDWTAMAAFVGGVWVAGSFIMRREAGRWSGIAHTLAAVGISTTALALFSTRSADFTHSAIAVAAAISLALLGRVRRSQGLVTLAAGTAILALPLALYTRWWEITTPHALEFLGLHLEPAALTLAGVLAAAGAALWSGKAIGMHDALHASARTFFSAVGAGVALVLAMMGTYHTGTQLSALCLTYLVLAMIPGVLSRVWKGRALEHVSTLALVPVPLLWIPAYALHWSPSSAPFVLHPGLGVAGLIAASWALCCRWVAETAHQSLASLARLACVISIGLLAFVGTSLEAARIAAGVTADPTVRGAALSMWWGVLAIVMITLGFWRRVQALRWMGLGVLGVAMFKAVFIDLREVPQLWRIVSFIGLGLMMLVVPVVYSRMSHVLKARRQPGTLPA